MARPHTYLPGFSEGSDPRAEEIRRRLAALIAHPHDAALGSWVETMLSPWEKTERYAAQLAAVRLARRPAVEPGLRKCMGCTSFLRGACAKWTPEKLQAVEAGLPAVDVALEQAA